MGSNPSPEAIWAFLAAYAAFIIGLVCFFILIKAVICWFLSTCIAKIPVQFRLLVPGIPWLFMLAFVPCLGPIFVAVFNFMFWPKLSQSFKAYFNSVGRTDVGDCGEGLANTYCILGAVIAFVSVASWLISLAGLVNCIAWPAATIIWVILLVKAGQYKGMIPDQVDDTPEFPISNTQS